MLENPNRIGKAALGKRLDSGTAYEILSIDITDLDVGENVGAKLQVDQAEADTRHFRVKAEQRRAMAVVQAAENRAKVVLAEAEASKAIAGAFRSSNLGIVEG